MWRAIILIAVAVVYLHFQQPELFPELLNTTIDKILKPGKRGNLFPPLSKTTLQQILDKDFGTGWIGSENTFRTKFGPPNPSGDPFYFVLAAAIDTLSATVGDLVIGRSYQLSFYIGYTVFSVTTQVSRVTMDDHNGRSSSPIRDKVEDLSSIL